MSQRDCATPKSVDIWSAAAQLYEKSHLTRRIALSCGIKISPVGSLDLITKHACDRRTDGQTDRRTDGIAVANTALAMRALRAL